MNISTPVEQAKKNVKRKKPTWKFYLKNRNASLHDAVALSMNICPLHVDQYIDENNKLKKTFNARLKAACLEMNDTGRIKLVEKGKLGNKSDWIVELTSFVNFFISREIGKNKKFRLLGGEPNAHVGKSSKSLKPIKPPMLFTAALMRLFVEIARRAQKEGMCFSLDEMPGQKKDLLLLADVFHSDLMGIKEATFVSYLKGFCKFSGGRNQETDFYIKLFGSDFLKPVSHPKLQTPGLLKDK